MCLPWNILLALHLKKVLPHRAEFFSDWTLKNADDATVSLLIGFTSYKETNLGYFLSLGYGDPQVST